MTRCLNWLWSLLSQEKHAAIAVPMFFLLVIHSPVQVHGNCQTKDWKKKIVPYFSFAGKSAEQIFVHFAMACYCSPRKRRNKNSMQKKKKNYICQSILSCLDSYLGSWGSWRKTDTPPGFGANPEQTGQMGQNLLIVSWPTMMMLNASSTHHLLFKLDIVISMCCLRAQVQTLHYSQWRLANGITNKKILAIARTGGCCLTRIGTDGFLKAC